MIYSDFNNFDVEDFASNESFIKWVIDPDEETNEFWRVFLIKNPELTEKTDRARTLVANITRAGAPQVSQSQVDLIWHKIKKEVASPTVAVEKKAHSYAFPYLPFAAVLLLIFLVATFYTQKRVVREGDQVYGDVTVAFIERVNETGRPMEVHVADGSVITLENHARIKYKNSYSTDSTRDVYMQGDAFFEVSKDPFKPFIVHSNEIITEVLGTSFRVRAEKDGERVIVSVKSGKVSVYAAQPGQHEEVNVKGVILLPNQEVNYERQQQLFDKKIVEFPEVLPQAAPDNNFVFENASMDKVFNSLEQAYGIEIIFNNERLQNCFITASLGSEPLFQKLNIICETIGATYEIIDAKVIISSSGC